MRQKMTMDDIQAQLPSLKDWKLTETERDAITKSFTFKDFNQAFAFMTSIAMESERICHHPEWFNVYKTVRIWLITHVSGGITERDIRLAAALDDVSRGVR